MNSLCAIKSYKNQSFITQVTYYWILCFYRTILTIFLFGVRGFATGFFQAISLYAPEVTERPDRVCSYIAISIHCSQVYPTTVRAFGISLCYVFTRIGSMIAPFIAQVCDMYACLLFIFSYTCHDISYVYVHVSYINDATICNYLDGITI